ncbi:MAG: rRNA maturation RNase YbeY [Clostridia bacterium]|nr:rRNA maturation RNase YbeY [Clostridia bacterium]
MSASGLNIKFSATKKFDEIDYNVKKTVRSAIAHTLDYELFEYDAEVSVTFCDNEYIRCLNKKYRKKDKPTDVLSFPMYEDGDFDPVECVGGAVLGDIVISVERTKEQAAELGNTFLHEIAFLAIHSTLHLLGYDHERSKDDEEAQCLAQREIIAEMGI